MGAGKSAMDETIAGALKALKKRDFQSWYAATAEQARQIIMKIIPPDAMVGIGDSSTLRQLHVIETVAARGNTTVNPFDVHRVLSDKESFFEFLFWPSLVASVCDVFLTGTNAVTEDGKIVSIDGVGNRVSGMAWGHQMAVIVAGKNKITRDLDEALLRIKNVIAPEHIRRKGGKSACTTKGQCVDCSGKVRICAVTSIMEHKPINTEINVVIVDQDLGLGWDRSWPADRINAISEHHDRYMCPLPPETAERVDISELWKMAKRKTGGRWLLGASD